MSKGEDDRRGDGESNNEGKGNGEETEAETAGRGDGNVCEKKQGTKAGGKRRNLLRENRCCAHPMCFVAADFALLLSGRFTACGKGFAL